MRAYFEALNFDQCRLRTRSLLATALSSLAAKSVSLIDPTPMADNLGATNG
jgi:hypothetical protein